MERQNYLQIYNGFCDTYNYLKNKGDIIWIDREKDELIDLPFSKGKAFVSIYFTDQLWIIYKYAEKYPDINFVCGGPLIQSMEDRIGELLACVHIPNLELTVKSVEEYFNIPEYSQRWNLNLDGIKNLHSKRNIYFSYQIHSHCYWNKCNFCAYPKKLMRTREHIDLSVINDIDFNGEKQVKVNMPCLNKHYMKTVFDQMVFDQNIIYDFYLRCDDQEINSLDNTLSNFKGPLPRIKFRMGIEFPSDRMLTFMNKGITLDEIIRTVKMFEKYQKDNPIYLYYLMIIRWPNLIKDDLIDFNKFAESIIQPAHTVSINPLFCAPGTEIHELWKNNIETKIYNGHFYKGYTPIVSDEVKAIDDYVEKTMATKTKKQWKLTNDYTNSNCNELIKLK